MKRLAVAAVMAVVIALPGLVAAQQAPASTTKSTYKAPRTPEGQPDLQGFWTSLTYTPFERPKELANKPFYTEKEAIEAFKKAVDDMDDQIVHYAHTDFGDTPVQTGARPSLRTSLIVDPPDGRIPPLTPEAQKRQAAHQAAQKAKGPLPLVVTDVNAFNGCIFNSAILPIIPGIYNSNYHIVQTAANVMLTYEWNTEHRIVPLDGRPHAPAAIRTYAGDGRGRWEGQTLVVETTNFSPKRNFYGSEGTFKLVERFTRVAADKIDYRFTVEDPSTWTKPWTAEVPLYKISGPMLEYACNENNQNPFTALKNARAQEKGLLAPANETRRGDPKSVILDREDEAVKIGGGTEKK